MSIHKLDETPVDVHTILPFWVVFKMRELIQDEMDEKAPSITDAFAARRRIDEGRGTQVDTEIIKDYLTYEAQDRFFTAIEVALSVHTNKKKERKWTCEDLLCGWSVVLSDPTAENPNECPLCGLDVVYVH